MQLTVLVLTTLLLSGCSSTTTDTTTRTTTTGMEPITLHSCTAFAAKPDGSHPYVINGCPLALGLVGLDQAGATTFALPSNATGLHLRFNVSTLSLGSLNVTLQAGAYAWALDFLGPYAQDKQGVLVPDHYTNATLDYWFSVCHAPDATLRVAPVGSYSGSWVEAWALVPKYPTVAGTRMDPYGLEATCNGAWNGQPMVESLIPPTSTTGNRVLESGFPGSGTRH